MRGAIRTAQKVGRRFRRANRLRRQNERARVLTSPTESSVAIPSDQEEGGSRQGELPRSGKRGWSGPCAVFALAAETERSVRLLTPPPCKHADSFALLLVLSKPKHRFGFVRRNGGAAVELSGLPGKRNGASPFGRYPLLHSSFFASRPLCWVVMRGTPPAGGEATKSPDHLFPVVRTFAFRLKFQWSAVGCPGRENRKSPCSPDRLSFP